MKYLSTILFSISCVCLCSQSPLLCGFDEHHQKLLLSDTSYRERHQQWEDQVYHRIKEGTLLELRQTHTIPVVVHIITPPGTLVGTGNNLTDQQVESGLALLNDAFANQGAFQSAQGQDIGIRFCLARRTPEGQPTNGITRHESTLVTDAGCPPYGTNMDNDAALKKIVAWDCRQYVNIWLVTDLYNSSLGCSLAGFAYFPGAPCSLDGIVQESRYWTTVSGTTVTAHEAGHYFGLYHTFQGGCRNDDCLVDGDKICDTPPDGSSSFAPCNTNSCHTDNPDLTDDNPNFMDYSSCSPVHFTAGQRERMRAGLELGRASLLTSIGCSPVVNLDAGVRLAIDENCRTRICPVIELKNFGLSTITSVTFEVTLSPGNVTTVNWTGTLPANQIILINSDCIDLPPGFYNTSVRVISVNSAADENNSNDVFTVSNTEIINPINPDFDFYNAFQLRYYFFNNSKFITSCKWDFGDGGASTDENPYHDYANQGQFIVTLTCYNSCGDSAKISRTIEIQACSGQLRGRVQGLNNHIEPDEAVCDIIQNGILHISPSLSDINYYWTFFSICDTICTGDGYTIKLRLKNDNAGGGINAFDTALEIIGEGENAGVNIMGEAWAIGYTKAWVGSSFQTNLPELIMDLSDWKTIEMELKNNLLTYKYEGNDFFLLEYPGKVCNIHNINLTFKGSGSVDWIQVFDANGNLVYEENFDDCRNLAQSLPCPDRPIHALIDVKDKCQNPKVYIKNLNNIDDPLIIQVVPAVPVNANGEYELEQPGEYKFLLSRTCPLADSSFVVVVAPPFKDSLVRIVQPVCKGSFGSIIVSGVGGLAPYEYTINGVDSPTGVLHDLTPGAYEIVVTDQNGCSAISSYIIQNPMMPISFGIDSSKFDITCQDPFSFIQLGITPADPDVYFTLDNTFLNNHGYFENMDVGTHEISVRDESGCITDTLFFEVKDLRNPPKRI